MDEQIQRIKSANDIKASKALELQRHEDMKVALINVQETILKSFTSLVNYLDGKVTKTVIVNQLREIGTPDALKVIPSIESLHETLKTHKNTDLTELTSLMTEMLAEAKMIPKDHMKMPEMMDYSDQLKELGNAVKAVETVIKAQNLVVDKMPPTDLKPLQGGLKDVVSAIKKIIIPEYKTDNKAVESLIEKSNDLLKKLLEKPVSRGGGGITRISPYQDSNGVPVFVELVNGKVPVDATITVPPVTIDTTGLATDTIQTNGTQKTQLVGSAGGGVTVTGGKLDVNVTIPPVTIDTTGLATDTLQTSGNSSLTTIAGKDFATETTLALIKAKTDNIPAQGQALATGSLPVVLPSAQITTLTPPAAISGFATSAKQLPDGHNVVVTSMPAVSIDTTGLATSAKQDTGNTSIASIDTKTPALGQALAAASVPVILPSATVTTLTPPAAITGFATATKQDTQDTSINTLLKPASTLAAVTTLGTITNVVHVDDNAGSLTVDGTVAVTNAGITTIAGAVAGTEMQVDVLTMPTVAVTGTFYQATQPVSLATLPVTNAGTFAVQSTEVAPTTVLHGKTTVTTAGTRVTLAGSTACKSVTIKALAANTGIIYVGSTTVASTNGFALAAGETVSLDIANLTTVNIDSSVNGESVTYIGIS